MSSNQISTIELFEEKFSFSVAHFTLFSPTDRERLHGHNYQVHASLTADISEYGITFDYAIYKEKIFNLCQQLNTYLLLPGESPILQIKEKEEYYQVDFHTDKMFFLKKDVMILPLRNITLEELSLWFLNDLIQDQQSLKTCGIHKILIRVSNGPGRFGSAEWRDH